MASGIIRDITPAMVYGLGHDKRESAGFSQAAWKRLQDERPMLASFLATRLRQAFPDTPASQNGALAVVVELVSLDERAVFADQMDGTVALGELVLSGLFGEPDAQPSLFDTDANTAA